MQPPKRQAQEALPTVNILLVDDEPKNLIALDAVLQDEGRRLVHASSGADALKALLQHDFALIILDVHMPGMDGFETASLIRDRERTRDVPIIFLTAANKSETFVLRGYSVGAVDYLFKPFDSDILRSKTAVFVDLYRKTALVKRQATQLAEATAFLNSVLESSTEHSITAMDLDGNYLVWNEGARRMHGYTAEEMVGSSKVHQIHAPEDVQSGRVDHLLAAALRKGNAEGVFEQVRKDGTRFMALVTVHHRQDAFGTSLGFVSVAQDITERLHAEEERAQLIQEQVGRVEAEAARDRLQQVLDVMPEAITIADANGRIYMSNSVAVDIMGQTPPPLELPDHSIYGMLRLDGTPYASHELPLARALLHGEVVHGEQLLIPNVKTGRQVPVLVNAAPLRSVSGTIDGGLVVFQDISPIKELEQQKDAFLAAASHDLKSPLTAIKARAQLLQRRVTRLPDRERQPLLDGLRGIDQTTIRLTGMINELLDVARLQMGRPLELDRRPTDLASLARQVAAEQQHTTERHQIRVQARDNSIVGQWDRVRLERVLTNLVSNAIKYSPEGGDILLDVTLEPKGEADHSSGQVAEREAGQAGESPQPMTDSPWAVLRVQEQGVGIPIEELERVFDRFYRGSNVSGKIDGTGLGLSGSRQIVEQHGGTLEVESTEGEGSTFTMRLPVAMVDAAAPEIATPSHDAAPKSTPGTNGAVRLSVARGTGNGRATATGRDTTSARTARNLKDSVNAQDTRRGQEWHGVAMKSRPRRDLDKTA